jgi:hypothetical protein
MGALNHRAYRNHPFRLLALWRLPTRTYQDGPQ